MKKIAESKGRMKIWIPNTYIRNVIIKSEVLSGMIEVWKFDNNKNFQNQFLLDIDKEFVIRETQCDPKIIS